MLGVLFLLTLATSRYLPLQRRAVQRVGSTRVGQTTCTPFVGNFNSTIVAGNCQDYLYYIQLQIGTPSQTLGFQFDTGSNTLWMPTQSASGTSSTRFNTSASSTYENTPQQGSLMYADGSGVTGTVGSDIVGLAGSSISSRSEILWVSQQNSVNNPSAVSGIVGMGTSSVNNFLDSAYQAGQISSSIFALQLTLTNQQSKIYFEQLPEFITNSSYWLDVDAGTYWQLPLLGFRAGGTDMTSDAADAVVIDSGTSLFYFNQALYNDIIGDYFGTCDLTQSQPICPCSSVSSWPTFEIILYGIIIYIHPQNYTAQFTNIQGCTFRFSSIGTVQNQLLLGDTLFRNYIISFDKSSSKIGFKGELGFVYTPETAATKLAGFILMGIMGAIVLMGSIAYCAMRTISSESYYTMGEPRPSAEIEVVRRYPNQTGPNYAPPDKFLL